MTAASVRPSEQADKPSEQADKPSEQADKPSVPVGDTPAKCSTSWASCSERIRPMAHAFFPFPLYTNHEGRFEI